MPTRLRAPMMVALVMFLPSAAPQSAARDRNRVAWTAVGAGAPTPVEGDKRA